MRHHDTRTDDSVPQTLTVGIVAGCCPTHNGVLVGQHFQEVLVLLARHECGVQVAPIVEPSTGMPATWRVSILAADGVDFVLLQIRPLNLITKSKLILRDLFHTKTVIKDAKPKRGCEADGGTLRPEIALPRRLVTTALRAIQAMNLTLGILSGGVGRRTVRIELEEALAALEVARQRQVPICVVGPTFPEKWFWLGRHVV